MQLEEPRERTQIASERSSQTSDSAPNGLVLVDKSAGPSSFDTVRATAQKLRPPNARARLKAGHAGTLDPAATGLLLVLVGKATRLSRYLVGLDKRYRTQIRLGLTTSTGDAEGDPLERRAPRSVSGLAEELVGEIELPIPAASAVKIDGERAYARHRRGEKVEMPSRRSLVHEAELIEASDERVTLELLVSSGTYIRAIAQHLGGHCLSIRRLSVGPFSVEDADPGRVLSPLQTLPFLARLDLDGPSAELVKNGRTLPSQLEGPALAVHGNELLAVMSCGDGVARPETVLAT